MSSSRRPDLRAALPPASQQLVEALDLQPPTAADPGYWKTHDGFVSVNVGLIRYGPDSSGTFRALVSFDPGNVQQLTKERVRQEIPDLDQLTREQRRAKWARILHIGKAVRTERVQEIVRALNSLGVTFPVEELVVHRVSNTFFATFDLAALARIVELHAEGYGELRRIHINTTGSGSRRR